MAANLLILKIGKKLMRTPKIVTMMLALVLFAMPACAILEAAAGSHSDHECPGEHQQDKPKVHSCCEQQALLVSGFHVSFQRVVAPLPETPAEVTEWSYAEVLFPVSPLYLTTGNHLSKLSILRI